MRVGRKASAAPAPSSLIIGYPGTVAARVARRLSESAGDVVVLARQGEEPPEDGHRALLDAGVTVRVGQPEAIDLGLPGPAATSILERLGTVYVLTEPTGADWRPPGIDAAREIVAFAGSAGTPAAVVALFPHVPRAVERAGFGIPQQAILRDPARGQGWPLDRVLCGRGASLHPVRLRCGIPVDPEGEQRSPGPVDVLKLIVLLTCCVDLRRMGSVAGRRLELTHAALAADAVIRAGTPDGRLLPATDLRDPASPSVARLNTMLGTLLDSVPGSGPEFRGNCRRHRNRLVRRWFGGLDPGEILVRWTSDESTAGGEGPGVARFLGSDWRSAEEVFAACLAPVVRAMRADIAREADAEDRDALLG